MQNLVDHLKFKGGERSFRISAADADLLRNRFGRLVPEWYIELLRAVPLAGTMFDLADHLGIGWLSPQHAVSEAFDAYPGLVVLALGYVPVAGCCMGSGDPYFLNFGASDDPPLIQVFHDAAEPGRTFDEGSMSRVICPRFSEFLKVATVV